ncbi:MAG: metal-dependent hydrolase [Promethearchaeota archaeon]|nr:MAG: metal-dependent hydrolase [Candidatus Lokiarchaeota archaeon]
MFPLFHIAVPLIIFEIPQIKKKYRVNRLALIIGSLFPDIADKSLMFLKLINGRGYFHSLFIVFLCFGILFLLTKGNKAVSFPFLIGMLFHLLLDLPNIPLFYPFISYDFKYIDNPLPYWIHDFLTKPVVQATEIIGIVCLLFIVIRNKLYSFKDIADYLRTNPKEIIYSIKKDTEIVISED